jgi:hypothetical protein
MLNAKRMQVLYVMCVHKVSGYAVLQ